MNPRVISTETKWSLSGFLLLPVHALGHPVKWVFSPQVHPSRQNEPVSLPTGTERSVRSVGTGNGVRRYWGAIGKTREEAQRTVRSRGDHRRTGPKQRQEQFYSVLIQNVPSAPRQLKPTQTPGEVVVFTASPPQCPSGPVLASRLF